MSATILLHLGAVWQNNDLPKDPDAGMGLEPPTSRLKVNYKKNSLPVNSEIVGPPRIKNFTLCL